MKKFILSSFLVFIFTAYVLNVRIMGASPLVLTPEPNKPKTTLNLPQYNETIVKSKIVPSPSPSPSPKPNPTPVPVPNTDKYKNGSYTGSVVDAYYGNVQVMAVISNGKIADVKFLSYPDSRQTSKNINSRAMPYLISEAIALQDSNVDTVSGASFTSSAFRKSLAVALSQARI